MDRGTAPAKVNLALHVTGRGADGYHSLDSLVVFAGVADRVRVRPARDLTLTVDGPFAAGVPTDGSNLVLRAARTLAESRGVRGGAEIRLSKRLPHAAGLGGGSADAAAALRVLARHWGVEPFAPDAPEVLALGADVPACLHAPTPLRMRGRGEAVEPLPDLLPRPEVGPGPEEGTMGLVLVNPGVALPTRDVFAALADPDNPPLPPLPGRLSFEDFAAWIGTLRNDLEGPARRLAPAVGAALGLLRRTPDVLVATMSGSGASCVGLTQHLGQARRAARAVRAAAPRGWWVAPAALMGS